MKTIRRPISILLAVLMVVGMFTMVPISAGATVYTENEIGEYVTTGDIIHLQGDYIEFETYSVVLKGGTYKVAGSNEVAQSDIQFEAWSGDGTTLHDDGFRHNGTKYVPVDANGYESGSWLVLDVNDDDGVITFRGMSDYYLAGTMNMWDTNDGTYELVKNPGNTDEYMLLDFAADANTEFKVVSVGEYIAPTNNFTLNEAGTYDIYFRPNGGGNTADGWVDGKVFANNFRPASSATYVAQIGSTKYETLADAFAAAVDGDTITLLADCAGNGIKVTPAGKFTTGLTVDFNGHTYTVDGETVGSTGTETNGFQLLKNNKVTFQNGTITSAKAKILVQNYSDLTLDGMTLTLNNPDYTEAYTLSNNNGNIVIDDTTINANPAGGFAFDVCRFSSYPSVNVTVKGDSEINGNVEISATKSNARDGFSLTLESGTMTGNIVLDQTAKNIIAATPEKAVITKAAAFDKAAPADYKWDANGVLVPCDYVAKIGDAKYETLADAIAAAQNGDTITLMADVTEIATISGKTLTLDLYGFNITSTSKKAPVRAENGAKLTIVNSNTDKAENTATQNAIMGPTGSNNYGSVSATGEGTTVDIYAGYYYGYNGNKTAVNAINGATVTFWGGTVNGAAGINDTTAGKEGKVFYSGVSNPTKPYATSPGTIIVHGGNFSGRMSDSNWGNYVIDGGTFDRNEVVLNENPVDADGNRVATASSSMTSIGTGTLAEAGWLADGYKVVDNGDGTYGVAPKDYVAQIGNTKYETLEEAFAAAEDGDTITVLADSAGNGIKVPAGKFTNGLTVDFKGHTYTVNANTVGSTGTETQGFQLLKNNKITFTNGTINGSSQETATLLFLIQNYSDLTLDKMNLELVGKFYNQYTLSNNNGNIVINDSTINAPTYGGVVRHDVNSYAFDVCRFSSYPSVHVTVTGNSTINGDVQVDAGKGDAKDGFSLNLNGGSMNGNIVLTDNAKTALANAPTKASVNKASDFNQAAPEGYMWVDTKTEGVQTIAKAVAQIGETKYATLEAAFAAAVDGNTIKVLADCSGNGIKVLKNTFKTKGLTVDFDGHTYTMDGATVGSPGTETLAFQLQYNNKITFKNGTLYSEKALFLVQNYSNLTLDGMTLTLDNPNYAYGYTLSNNYGNTVIKDTTINANPAGKFAFDVCRGGGSDAYKYVNVTVEGNSFINGDVEVDARNGNPKTGFSLNLNGGTMTGDIKLTANAETAIDNNPDKASVNKADGFNQDPAEGYEWKDNGDGTSTLVKIPDLFAGYGLSLQGDIGLIFYLDPAAAHIDIDDVDSVAVDFDCDHYTYQVTDFTKSGDHIKVTCYVPAAYMAHEIKAYHVKINDVALDDTDTYSVQQYAERIIEDPAACNIPADKADEAVALMKEMLNYGAKAQEVFKGQMLAPADYDDLGEKYGYTMATVTADMIDNAIHGDATDMSTVHPEADANFYAPSVIYLSKTTLRMVFLIPTGNGSTCPDEYSGHQGVWYYWKDVTDIPAAELDEQQQFEINGVTFNYSVLDYAKAVVAGGSPAQKDLAASLYLYNQAANAYFAD